MSAALAFLKIVTQLTLHHLAQNGRNRASIATSRAVASTGIRRATKLRWYLAVNTDAKLVLVASLAAEGHSDSSIRCAHFHPPKVQPVLLAGRENLLPPTDISGQRQRTGVASRGFPVTEHSEHCPRCAARSQLLIKSEIVSLAR